jgi:AcrR family transcriptional regulator
MQVTVTNAARRAQIVEAAIGAIAELGSSKASFAQIAKRAGISSTRLISYHFEDRTELIRAVLGTVLTEAAAYMRPHLDAATGPAATLAAYIEANLAFIHSHPNHIRAVMDIAVNARDLAGSSTVDTAGPVDAVGLLVKLFEDGQTRGDFRAFDPRVMAVSLRAAVDAAAGPLTGPSPADLSSYTAELVALFDRATRKDRS